MQKEIVRNSPIPMARKPDGQPLVPLSHAVKAGGFVFVAGMPPINPSDGTMVRGDIETQTRRVLDNLRMVLEAAGSSLEKVVKTTVFATNVAYFDIINDIYRKYFVSDPPARTFVTVGSW